MDSHADTLHVAVISDNGGHLADAEFDTTAAGYAAAVAFLTAHGHVIAIGVEGTSSYGAGFTRTARARDLHVVEVNRPDRAERRRAGKSDPIDAYAAARAALSGRASSAPKTDSVAGIRALHNAARSCVKARTAALNQIGHLLISAPDAIRATYRRLTGQARTDALARLRPTGDRVHLAVLTALKSLARRVKELTAERLAEAHRRQGATDERERLAREIHDTLAQGFASIVVLAEAARTGLRADPRRSAEQLLSIERTARDNLAEARVLVSSGAPRSGVGLGQVVPALRRTLDRFAEDTGLAVSADLPDVACDQQTRIALLRCTQESLANVRKHAEASTVGIVLARYPHGFELEITDDGRGFLIEDSRGFGLDGMRKRLAELGGELTVTSSPGEGTRVLAMIPTTDQV
ncbi:transposase [Streptomyces sp. B6B3]|uniref:IS110 family transposase n=1 Tax=Streptomyces sp. B6B3 TaxID=3153570 RepID=UPI00325EEE4F